mmetsp:Transcript_8314/g.8475  ORF Transcript_8314/g.8475 Transcript_8314/m.8475 type:complete len:299 (+) Transcript_8314:51-947(+)
METYLKIVIIFSNIVTGIAYSSCFVSQSFINKKSFRNTVSSYSLCDHTDLRRIKTSYTSILKSFDNDDIATINTSNNAGLNFISLFAIGSVIGPLVDALHNKVLLQYDILPITLPFDLKTSLLIPPLLGITYVCLGIIFPSILSSIFPDKLTEMKPLLNITISPIQKALLAIISTSFIIKLSGILYLTIPSITSIYLILTSLVLLQWKALDGSYVSLILAIVVSFVGPIAEIPFMKLGAWHYLNPDYWPLSLLASSLGPGTGADWAGLSLITGPCYFAVTTDAITLSNSFKAMRSNSS